ncbi:dal80p-controlled protein [Purpureocillium takamizusanense]|uniref:Dal80p-controlled protein n=1 Tax=Purpureocillium takamizusanense TaxID=2060973 RepID=A0A9Q8QJY6_9HYPO|nr:dal80p-controlled protein [Purpureocillium takamizusanense]UNI21253.1 dal80p-controlled protein [Purpureocillium takamizusanense]
MAQQQQQTGSPPRPRILLLNPNSNTGMTESMAAVARSTPVSPFLDIVPYTCASGTCPSIDNQHDIDASARSIWRDIRVERTVDPRDYDAVLVACFSVHPLVRELAAADALLHLPAPTNEDDRGGSSSRAPPLVTGIFEAGVHAAVTLVNSISGRDGDSDGDRAAQWGIITTGEFWEAHLTEGVGAATAGGAARFAGTFSTGLTAGQMHSMSADEVRERLAVAARRLLLQQGGEGRGSGSVRCIVMGCGGMAGLEDTIRETARELHGDDVADGLYIIDGVKAGVMYLYQVLASRKMYSARKS